MSVNGEETQVATEVVKRSNDEVRVLFDEAVAKVRSSAKVAATEVAKARCIRERQSRRPAGALPCLLIVEDDPLMASSYQRQCRGLATLIYTNTVAGGRCACGAMLDAAVVDLLLPDGSGAELIEELLARNVPVYVVSGLPYAGIVAELGPELAKRVVIIEKQGNYLETVTKHVQHAVTVAR